MGECIISSVVPVGFSFPSELKVLKSQYVEVFVKNKTEIDYYKYTENGKITTYYTENILHLRLSNPIDNDERMFRGYSPLRVLESVFSASNSNFTAEAAFLENRGVQGFISNGSDLPMLNNDKDELQKSFNRRHSGSEKFGQIAITNANLKYVAVGANPSDLQLLDSNISKLRVICATYGLSSQLFGDSASSTYNNMETAEKRAYTNCYIPLAKFFIDQINKWIQDTLKQSEKIKIGLDKIEVLNAVNKELSDKVINEVKAGILSQEQAFDLLYPKSEIQFDSINAKPQTNVNQNQSGNN
jgi:HK97 family phage portal protein